MANGEPQQSEAPSNGVFAMDPEPALRQLARHLIATQKEMADLARDAQIVRALGANNAQLKELLVVWEDFHHRKIEEALRANKGLPVTVHISPILAEYRGLIDGHSGELRTFVADETVMLGNEFKLAPPGQDGDRGTGDGEGRGDEDGGRSTEDGSGGPGDGKGDPLSGSGRGTEPGAGNPGGMHGDGGTPGAYPNPVGPVTGRTTMPGTDAPSKPQPPSMPQVPSLPSTGGGGSSPLSGAATGGMGPLSGVLGGGNPAGSSASGLAGSAGSAANPAAVQQASARAMSSAVGGEFGRSFAAGAANAAGGVPVTPAQPVPQTPSTPLGVPPAGATTSVSAAPASASMGPGPLAAPALGSSMGVPASATGVPGGGTAAPMTPYGSVLPPAPPAGAAAAGGPSPASLASPPPSATGGGAPSSAPPSFIPAVRDSAAARVDRGLSMNDLESARAVVADLAAASSAVYPGLQWAVVVARGASGMPEMWVTTNEGAGYIPHGVFVSRAMPLAAGLDPAFDARWFGWSNPAETVLTPLTTSAGEWLEHRVGRSRWSTPTPSSATPCCSFSLALLVAVALLAFVHVRESQNHALKPIGSVAGHRVRGAGRRCNDGAGLPDRRLRRQCDVAQTDAGGRRRLLRFAVVRFEQPDDPIHDQDDGGAVRR